MTSTETEYVLTLIILGVLASKSHNFNICCTHNIESRYIKPRGTIAQIQMTSIKTTRLRRKARPTITTIKASFLPKNQTIRFFRSKHIIKSLDQITLQIFQQLRISYTLEPAENKNLVSRGLAISTRNHS